MLFKKILLSSTVAFASVAYAAPTAREALTDVEVFTDGSSTTEAALKHFRDHRLPGYLGHRCHCCRYHRQGLEYGPGMVDSDTNSRTAFNKQVVGSAASQFRGKNVVMSNVGYSFTGANLTTQHAAFKARIGANVDFDVPVFDNGHTFTLKCDGGF